MMGTRYAPKSDDKMLLQRGALQAGSEGLSEATPLVPAKGKPSRSDGSHVVPRRAAWRWNSSLLVFCVLSSCPPAHAHAPDTSYLRAVVSKHALELRFTFDLATLHRIVRLDADNDGKVTRSEAEAVAPDIADFLGETITLELNGEKAALGTLQPLGWPLDAGEFIEEKNYGQTLVHFTFATSAPRLIEDFYVLYEVFGQLGAQHRVVANIEQEEKHLEVVFTQFEPDYLYDTFWREEPAPVLTFRSGVQDAWSRWWLPCVVAIVVCLVPAGRMGCCMECLAVLWVALAIESHAEAGRGSWLAGLFMGFTIVALIAWPLRHLVAACRERCRSFRPCT